MVTTRNRLVRSNETIVEQVDFFQVSDGYTRITGLTISQTQQTLFFNNVLAPWQFVTGLGVTDAMVASGKVYFAEIPGSSGYYSVRFRPNAVGYWRLSILYPTASLGTVLGYDVISVPTTADAGLQSSFIRT